MRSRGSRTDSQGSLVAFSPCEEIPDSDLSPFSPPAACAPRCSPCLWGVLCQGHPLFHPPLAPCLWSSLLIRVHGSYGVFMAQLTSLSRSYSTSHCCRQSLQPRWTEGLVRSSMASGEGAARCAHTSSSVGPLLG